MKVVTFICFYVIVRNGGNFMDYELLEKAAMTKYEMSKKDPFRFFIRSIVARSLFRSCRPFYLIHWQFYL